MVLPREGTISRDSDLRTLPMAWAMETVVSTRKKTSATEISVPLRRQCASCADEPSGLVTPERAAAQLTLSDGRNEKRLQLQSLPGFRTLYLYPAVVPFVPQSVRIEPLQGSSIWVEALRFAGSEEPAGGIAGTSGAGEAATTLPGPLTPLPVDPGLVLLYDPAQWRSTRYELFSWSRFPEVLIFDTADYEIQSRFFKRLAFYVEKRGFRGRLAIA